MKEGSLSDARSASRTTLIPASVSTTQDNSNGDVSIGSKPEGEMRPE
jgi:hypothetical protein